MTTPKISVIVPVYKAEAYLHRCVNSLLTQTFQDFEILLIDDGSPDNSGKICDDYVKKDSRVRVIHKENGGVSSARQCGIDNSLGEYTIHADPDDWVEPNMLEELYRKAKEEDADMIICDFFIEKREKQNYVSQKPTSLDHEIVLKELFQQLHGSCCNKLIRRSCYNDYNIRFPNDFSLNEDLYVNMALLRHNLKIAYLPSSFYHYQIGINENSIVFCQKYSEKRYKEDKIKIKMFSDMMKGHHLRRMAEDRMIVSFVGGLFEWGQLSSFVFCKETLKYILSILRYKYYPKSTKIKLLLSCIGFYRIIYKITLLIR